MKNLTIDEFYEELEKSNTTIRELVEDNFDMVVDSRQFLLRFDIIKYT